MEIRPALTIEMVRDLKSLTSLKKLGKAIQDAFVAFTFEIPEGFTLTPIELAKRLLDQSEDPELNATLLHLCDNLNVTLPKSIIEGRPLLNVDVVQLLHLTAYATEEYARIEHTIIFKTKEYQDFAV